MTQNEDDQGGGLLDPDALGRSATELFLRRAENGCFNCSILRRMLATSHRPSADTHEVDILNLSDEHILPTLEKLKAAARSINEVSCPCDLCQNYNVAISTLSDQNLVALAVLLSCGCLFAFKSYQRHLIRRPALPDQNLQAFANEVCRAPGILFERSSDDYTVCTCSPRMQEYATMCARCKAEGFRAAVNLKVRVFSIPNVDVVSDEILDWNNCNIPFLDDISYDHDQKNLNVEYSYANIEPTACSRGFEHRKVFRKKYHYLRTESEDQVFDTALKEARIAMLLAKVHPNIVSILFAFETQDKNWRRIELVFPRYEGTLENYFSSVKNDPPGDIRSSLVQDPLWMTMVDVVGAIASVHHLIEQDISPRFSGHFDIKPANLLVQGSGDDLKLILTDFGQAAKNRAGDISYAPPENSAPSALTPAYDVWSLACILIRCLIFIGNGSKGLETFVGGLGGAGSPCMLWVGSNYPLDTTLSTPVLRELARMQNESDRSTAKVTAQIQMMLNIIPSHRPTSRECYMEFSQAEETRFLADLDHMSCGLESWRTSSTRSPGKLHHMPRRHMPVPLCLSLWRTSRQSNDEEGICLEIQKEPGDVLRHCSQVRFQPLAFYDKPLIEAANEPGTDPSFICRFDGLHEDRTFHFHYMGHYLKFMTLITQHQIVCTSNSVDGLQAWFHSAILKRTGASTLELEGGNVQVWRLLEDREYDEAFCRTGRTATVDPQQQPESGAVQGRRATSPLPLMERTRTVRTNIWKMALWTCIRRGDNDSRRVCVVVDIGDRRWRLRRSKKDQGFLVFEPDRSHNYFFGQMFEPLEADAPSTKYSGFPGVPISPSVLSQELKLKMRKLTIRFEGKEASEALLNILRQQHFPVPDIL